VPGNPDRRRTFGRASGKSRLGFWTAVVVLFLVAAYLGVLELTRPHVKGDRLRYDSFVMLVEQGRIREARVLDEDSYIEGTYVRDDGAVGRYNTPLVRGTQGPVLELLVTSRIPTTVEQQVGKRVASIFSLILPGLILIVLFVYLILSSRRGTGLFAIRSGARRITPEKGGVTFADVAGQDAAIAELREIKEFLADPQRFAALGATVPKGILLFGPPGCGKTLLARALAGEAGANFYSISGSDFVELYVGVGAARVRDLFREARENAPALIFIDELDSIGRARGVVGTVASHGEQEQGLNQILAEMDGFSPVEGIIVLGATNRPDVLDQALLRPGRFDRTIALERPDEEGRLAILKVHARGKRLDADVDLGSIAQRAFGLTGADLANVMNEGALLAARAGKSATTQTELDEALDRILTAPDLQRRLSLREKSVGRRFAPRDRVTFADLAGVEDAIEELNDVRDYLADPDGFTRMGARAPRGILLFGPSGCGKTLLARAVAGEANAAFFSVSGSDFVEVFVGVGASRVRDLFAEAKSVAPSILFIDEIDSIGATRAALVSDGHREREQTLNQILVELDGFEDRSAVIVMAATNRPDMLDPALVRPGRFDRQVEITLPDREGRLGILRLHAKGKPLAPDVDLDAVAGLTRGFSGADLANVMNEAALLATRGKLDQITMSTMDLAIERALLGVASRGTLMSEPERRVVAYHEAGHAITRYLLPGGDLPHKISVVARGHALGHVSRAEDHDHVLRSRSAMIEQMAGLLGGRIAEEIVFGEPSAGASNDLVRVGDMAWHMVCDLGMSERLGPLAFPGGLRENGRAERRYSDATSRMIDAEVRRLVEEAAARAREVLNASRTALDQVAGALLEKETLDSSEFGEMMQPAKLTESS
jgi:ATP-dependent metalloprotease FtsH